MEPNQIPAALMAFASVGPSIDKTLIEIADLIIFFPLDVAGSTGWVLCSGKVNSSPGTAAGYRGKF